MTPEDWNRIATRPGFAALRKAKARFVVPATIFFLVYYFALLILVGYFPAWMKRRVVGPLNLAYLFALSQFGVAWVLAWMYVRRAAQFDRMAAALLDQEKLERGEEVA